MTRVLATLSLILFATGAFAGDATKELDGPQL